MAVKKTKRPNKARKGSKAKKTKEEDTAPAPVIAPQAPQGPLLSYQTNIPEDIKQNFIAPQFAGPIATKEELQTYWTSAIAWVHGDDKDRLKASELLGKSLCMFPQKLEHSGDPEKPIRHVYTLGTNNLGGPV